jgi:tetratricopeptide (TPR) repeat protein
MPLQDAGMSNAATLADAARLHDAGEFDAARAAYRCVIDAQPRNARALYLLGLLERASGDREGAMSCLQQAIDVDPAQGDAWLAIGDLHAEAGADALAIEAFERSVGHDRGNSLGWFKLGFAREKLERHAEAEKAYRRAVTLAPMGDEYHSHLARALSAVGRYPEALQEAGREPNERFRLVALATVDGLDGGVGSTEAAQPLVDLPFQQGQSPRFEDVGHRHATNDRVDKSA